MELKLALAVVALAASVCGAPVPPNGPKYVPVFVSSEALNNLNDKEGPNGNKPASENGESQGPTSDYDLKKEIQHIFNGPPAPVHEHQPDQHGPSYSPQLQNQLTQQQYQNQQPGQIPQYQNNQQLVAQPYQVNQQPIQPQYQINQQPSQIQQYQTGQPGQSQLFQLNQQPGQLQQIVTQPAQYGNQQQILANQQPIGQQAVINQQPMLYNQQQLVPQPVQTYQQPNQFLIASQPAGNQQAILTQPNQPILLNQQTLPNQHTILLQQPNQNGQLLTSNINPINFGQPNNQVNPGYIPNQNQNVYTMVPLNQNVAPNQNVGTNTYLVPVQQLPNNLVQQAPNQIYAVNSG